jgi:hypothetical protein
VCWTLFKNNQILLHIISHKFLVTGDNVAESSSFIEQSSWPKQFLYQQAFKAGCYQLRLTVFVAKKAKLAYRGLEEGVTSAAM